MWVRFASSRIETASYPFLASCRVASISRWYRGSSRRSSALTERHRVLGVEDDFEAGDPERPVLGPHLAGDDPGRQVRHRTLDDLGDEDVRGERSLAVALFDHVDVRPVVTERVRAAQPVLGLPRHDVVATGDVAADEVFERGGTGVGAADEAHVVGEQPGEHVEPALVVVPPPPADEVLHGRGLDHFSIPPETDRSSPVTNEDASLTR